MNEYVLKMIGAVLGSVGFGLIFHGEKRNILVSSFGSLLGIIFYLICTDYYKMNIFICALIAGFVCDIYAEIMARVLKAPSTTFFLVATIPLIPGSTLYYCIDKIVVQDSQGAIQYGMETFLTALGICVGMSIAWAICDLLRKININK